MRTITWKQKSALVVLGVTLSLALVELSLRAAGFVFIACRDYRNRCGLREKGVCRVLCLGESTTALGGRRSYPAQLQRILNRRVEGVRFAVINLGKPASNSRVIVGRLDQDLRTYDPDIVVAMMGINDSWAIADPAESRPRGRAAALFRSMRSYKLLRWCWSNTLAMARGYRTYPAGVGGARHGRDVRSIRERADYPAAKTAAGGRQGARGPVPLPRIWGPLTLIAQMKIQASGTDSLAGRGWEGLLGEDYEGAALLFRDAVKQNPLDDDAHVGLGWARVCMGDTDAAYREMEEALRINPKNDGAYVSLASWAYLRGELDAALAMLRRAIEINPGNDLAHIGLGLCYKGRGDMLGAKRIFEEAVARNPIYRSAWQALAECCRDLGDTAAAERHFRKAAALNSLCFPETRRNYLFLREAVRTRGKRLVCVQYPTRSAEPLRQLFAGDREVVIVDNEASFREAVAREGYGAYFNDSFAGDFGHCTDKGNGLLAGAVADAIVSALFPPAR